MITPITRRDVIAHQSVVPWPSQVQVEQDLLLCRAMGTLPDAHLADRRFCSDMNPFFGWESLTIHRKPGIM